MGNHNDKETTSPLTTDQQTPG